MSISSDYILSEIAELDLNTFNICYDEGYFKINVKGLEWRTDCLSSQQLLCALVGLSSLIEVNKLKTGVQ